MKGYSNYLHRRDLFDASQMLKQKKRQTGSWRFSLICFSMGEEKLPRTDSYFRISDYSIHNTMTQPREDYRGK